MLIFCDTIDARNFRLSKNSELFKRGSLEAGDVAKAESSLFPLSGVTSIMVVTYGLFSGKGGKMGNGALAFLGKALYFCRCLIGRNLSWPIKDKVKMSFKARISHFSEPSPIISLLMVQMHSRNTGN